MATHTIEIPNWLPVTLNNFMRVNPMRRRGVVKSAAEFVAGYAKLAGVPVAQGRRRVTLAFRAPEGKGAKVGDPDSRQKVALDALVLAGMIVDDSDRWCDLMPRVRERGAVRTLITLEDLDG
jgi:hypothetical protein